MSQDSSSFQWRYGDLDDNNFKLHKHNLLIVLLLLSLVIFLLLLVFLFRRKCCSHMGSLPAASVPSCGAQEGIDDAAVKSLPMRVRRGEAVVCSICLSLLMEGEKERVLPACSHGFHVACVDEWLRKRSTCPLCRTNVVPPEEKEKVAIAAVQEMV